MLNLRRVEIRDKFTGDVIGEVTQDTRRDLRAKIHKAFQAEDAVRRTSFDERAELGYRVARRLEERRNELEELMVREAGQPCQFARWEIERAICERPEPRAEAGAAEATGSPRRIREEHAS